jgi:hypothetical protein
MKRLGVWVGVAAFFGALLLWAEHSRNRLDDPDPALQRPGYLLPAGSIRQPGAIPHFPRPGHRTALIFARAVDGQMLFPDLALQSDLSVMGDLLLVSADGRAPTITEGLQAIVADRDGRIAQAFGMDTPIDGGYPVGYALTDRAGFVRHRTLDPHCLEMGHGYEIRALLRAIP